MNQQLHLDNLAAPANTETALVPAQDTTGKQLEQSRPYRPSRNWLTWSSVEAPSGEAKFVRIAYYDADVHHEATTAIAEIDALERKLRAQLRQLRPDDPSRAALTHRLRELPRDRAAHSRNRAPNAEVRVPVLRTAEGAYTVGTCTCRRQRVFGECSHPGLAKTALDVWLHRADRTVPAFLPEWEPPVSSERFGDESDDPFDPLRALPDDDVEERQRADSTFPHAGLLRPPSVEWKTVEVIADAVRPDEHEHLIRQWIRTIVHRLIAFATAETIVFRCICTPGPGTWAADEIERIPRARVVRVHPSSLKHDAVVTTMICASKATDGIIAIWDSPCENPTSILSPVAAVLQACAPKRQLTADPSGSGQTVMVDVPARSVIRCDPSQLSWTASEEEEVGQ